MKRTRTAAQRAAFKKMIAALHRSKLHGKRKTPRRKKHATGKHQDQIIIMQGGNKVKHHRKKTVHHKRKHRMHGRSYIHHARRHHRRRYMHGFRSSIGSAKVSIMDMITTVGIGAAGGIAAAFGANYLPSTMDKRLKAGIVTALGLALGISPFARKNKMIKAAGTGIAIVGGLSLVRAFVPSIPVLSGEANLSLYNPYERAMLGVPTSPYAHSLLGIPTSPYAHSMRGDIFSSSFQTGADMC